MKSTILTLITFFSVGSYAGFFSSEPTKEFLDLEVCGIHLGQSCTLKEFSELALGSDAKKSWEKDGDKWLLRIKTFDKATNTKNELVLSFEKEAVEGRNYARARRLIFNKEDATSLYNNLMIPIIQEVANKVSRKIDPPGSSKKSKK